MAGFRLGLVARIRRYWPAGLVVAVATGFVALTMIGSSAVRNSLLGPQHLRPPDLELRQWMEIEDGRGSEVFESAFLDGLESLPEVDWVESSLTGSVFAEVIGSFRLATTDSDPAHRHWQLTDGRLPSGPGEVAVSSRWLEFNDLIGQTVGLGDQVKVGPSWDSSQAQPLEIVGVVGPRIKYGGYNELELLITSPGQAQSILGLEPGQTLGFLLKLAPGVEESTIVKERLKAQLDCPDCYLRTVYHPDLELVDGATAFIAVFVFLAVFVAIFVIINIFRIILAGQVRDLATLRLLGSTRTQVRNRLLGEAILAALAAGILSTLIVWGLIVLAVAVGNHFTDLTLYGPKLTVFNWLVPVGVGFLSGWIGSMLPAYTAARRRPVEALGKSVETSTANASLVRLILGSTLTGLSLIGMLLAVRVDLGQFVTGAMYSLGVFGLLLGLVLFSAGLARPFGLLLGWLGRPLGGPVWRLGAGNIGRQPARSAAVANSLMIGISLITVVTVLASSFSASSQKLIDERFPSDYIIGAQVNDPLDSLGSSEPGRGLIDPGLAGQLLDSGLLHQPTVVHWGSDAGQVERSNWLEDFWSIDIVGVDPQTVAKNLSWDFQPAETDPAEVLAAGKAYINVNLVHRGFDVGQTISVDYSDSGQQIDYVIGGVVDPYDPNFDLSSGSNFDLLISADSYVLATGEEDASFIVGDAPPGQSRTEVQEDLEALLVGRPDLAVYNLGSLLKDQIDSIIGIVLNVFRVLLGLSLLVAVLGIFSTLILSVGERRRELGTLRAVGLTRGQTSSLIVFEGVTMALFGAVLGVFAGWMGSLAIFNTFRTQPEIAENLVFSLPWMTLIIYGLVAAVFGALAALIPAWLAGRRTAVDALSDD